MSSDILHLTLTSQVISESEMTKLRVTCSRPDDNKWRWILTLDDHASSISLFISHSLNKLMAVLPESPPHCGFLRSQAGLGASCSWVLYLRMSYRGRRMGKGNDEHSFPPPFSTNFTRPTGGQVSGIFLSLSTQF